MLQSESFLGINSATRDAPAEATKPVACEQPVNSAVPPEATATLGRGVPVGVLHKWDWSHASDHRILAVDDSPINLKVVLRLLKDRCQVATAASGEEALRQMSQIRPEVVLLDIDMPGLSGYEVCRRVKSSEIGPLTQVIMVSGKSSTAERLEAYECGADDYLVKPYDHDELIAKVGVHFRLLESNARLSEANEQIRLFNDELECLVNERTTELLMTRDIAVMALASLAESRDPETGEHLYRIQNYSRLLTEEMLGRGLVKPPLDDSFVADVARASVLHDIGKVGIPDAVLLKPDRLTESESQIMQRHTTIGAEALLRAADDKLVGRFLTTSIEVARHHHERYDGKGYPDGIRGDEIPLAARIVALADVFDAITSARVYKPAIDPAEAKRIIESERGMHFDPEVVDAFLARYDEFLEVHRESHGRDQNSDTYLGVDIRR